VTQHDATVSGMGGHIAGTCPTGRRWPRQS
jgi:hypothetical protein